MKPLLTLLALCAAAAQAADEPPPPGSAAALLAAAPAAHWRALVPENTLVMTLPQGQVVMELAPQFAPAHVANIRTLARGHYWDGLAILRAQDNFVVQWGDPGEDIPGEPRKPLGEAKDKVPAEFERPAAGLAFTTLPDADAWATQVGFVDGMPVARAGDVAWLTHCYGMVGAGRDSAPGSSTGAQLYAVIGQAPRALDRNITVVGRVVQGMEWLATLRRGPPPMGFYADPAQRTPITTVRLASELPPAQRPQLELLRTDSPTFAALNQLRRERKDGWTVRPPAQVELCGVAVPVRAAPPAAGERTSP